MTDQAVAENEHRVFGPPGTGKTTYLSAMIRKTMLARETKNLMVASFTVAAAQEIASRQTGLHHSKVGTLHSMAYRACDHPELVVDRLVEFNRAHPAMAVTVTPGRSHRSLDEAPAEWLGATAGDELLNSMESYRARQIPRSLWKLSVTRFAKAYEGWKVDNDLLDFTDLIETALETGGAAPGAPEVGFFDEAQDFTRLELSLIRAWGAHMDTFVLAGDDDQMLYAFKGATVDALIEPEVIEGNRRVLSQSYRVPREVHAKAQAWVERLSQREPKDYLPRDADGAVRLGGSLRFAEPTALIHDVVRQIDAGRTVMLLATCGYMVDPVKHELRRQGVPFHNPYRRRPDWNPLRVSRGASGADKLLTYLIADERIFGEASRLWTGEDIRRWGKLVKSSEVFRRGGKAAIDALPAGEVPYELVADLFDETEEGQRHLEQATEPSLAWFARHLLASQRAPLEYPIAVARRRGAQELILEPKVVIGTIHSVKGGQADVVYLCPDLSGRGYQEWQHPKRRDSVIRQMYVGMTRAREELVICEQNSHLCVDPVLMMGGR